MRNGAAFLAELLLAMTFVGGCGPNLPRVPLAPIGNEPVPLPEDLVEMLEQSIRPGSLQAADGTSPPVSASQALKKAGEGLTDHLSGNNVPLQDASAPDGLVRRLFIDRERPPTSVWIVAYRWDAGFNCHDDSGGPGPCDVTSFFLIDDRTGEMVYSFTGSS